MVLEVPEMKTTESSESLLGKAPLPSHGLTLLPRHWLPRTVQDGMLGWDARSMGSGWSLVRCLMSFPPAPPPKLHFQDTGGQQRRKQHVFCEQL